MTENLDNIHVNFDRSANTATISNGKNSLEIQLFDTNDVARLQAIYERIAANKCRCGANKQRTR